MRFRVKMTVTEVVTITKVVEADSGKAAKEKLEARWREQGGEVADRVLSADVEQIGKGERC